MFFIMGVTLFTSRVVLDKLGVVDYGLFNAVGGVVAMLGFLNGTLSTGTSRFLTFELGTGNTERLKCTFSTAFYSHLLLALAIAAILETGGLWFIYHKLIIPPERMSAAIWCFHISIITTIVSITQVPYTAVIIAHENMSIYAWLGIFEAVSKLVIVYLLCATSWDRLIFYSALVAIVQILVALFYRFYSQRHYWEARLHLIFDRPIFKEMIGFSGWSLIANLAEVLSQQGYIILINMFFQPAIVAAQAVGNQISGAMMQFVNSFRTAINPQIIKLYASKEYAESRKLTLNSSIYVFDLLLLLGLPIIVLMEPLLNLWLVKVPDYAVVFAQYIVARNILANFSGAFYIPMIASGKLKDNSAAAVYVSIFSFVILYFILKYGGGVMWVQYMGLITTCIFSFLVKPIVLNRRIDYPAKELLNCLFQSAKISIFPIAVSCVLWSYFNLHSIIMMCFAAIIIMITVCISAYIFMDKIMKKKMLDFIKRKLIERKR